MSKEMRSHVACDGFLIGMHIRITNQSSIYTSILNTTDVMLRSYAQSKMPKSTDLATVTDLFFMNM